MPEENSESKYWDQAVKEAASGPAFDPFLAEQYRRTHLNLLDRWADITDSKRILKTDLFAEALEPSRAFLWDLLKANGRVIGIDISAEATTRAKAEAVYHAPRSPLQCVSCDVRQLPFASDTFDLIVSDSTLDHFHHKHEIAIALSELSRVLSPGGTLIITMDNKGNFTEPLFRLWLSLRLHPFFIGKTYSVGELKQALANAGLAVVETTAIIHNPRFFARRMVPIIRKAVPVRFDRSIKRCLAFLDSLENRKTKYLTGQFIAAKAVKYPY
jgi:SAM-dependent methyltransferase